MQNYKELLVWLADLALGNKVHVFNRFVPYSPEDEYRKEMELDGQNYLFTVVDTAGQVRIFFILVNNEGFLV